MCACGQEESNYLGDIVQTRGSTDSYKTPYYNVSKSKHVEGELL